MEEALAWKALWEMAQPSFFAFRQWLMMEIKPHILIVDDDEVMCHTLSDVLKKMSYEVTAVQRGDDALHHLREGIFDLILLDIILPDMNGMDVLEKIREVNGDTFVIMMTAYADVQSAVTAMKAGAYDYINKPFEIEELRLTIKKALETKELKGEVLRLRSQHKDETPDGEICGISPQMDVVRELISLVGKTPRTPVLIQGESGTGKELVANAIHFQSRRQQKPLIKINCSAIPESLLESELFGHEKGAFTDAKESKPGLIELAHGGTVFLDEISEMNPALQPKLLRFLETYTLRRVGGKRDIKVDVRVVASTNKDLSQLVDQGEFRKDLYYRIKVMVIELPSLSDRKEDIPILTDYFIAKLGREMGREIKRLSPQSLRLLVAYSWPGNVRELKNVMERAMILTKGDLIRPDDLPLELRKDIEGAAYITTTNEKWTGADGLLPLADIERNYILRVLREKGGNKSKTARILGVSRSTLREKLNRYRMNS
jgi:two-component system response regulator AtoC